MDNKIQLFHSDKFGDVRALSVDGEPWFVAKDVCVALAIKNSRDALARLDDDEKGVALTDTPGGEQRVQTVNEAGLYTLVLSSRKPEAHAFKRWVTHEVLPAIRRTGGYMVARDETPEQTMARALLIAQETMERQRNQIDQMRPKARFAEAVETSHTSILVGDFAKILRQNGVEIGQNRLFQWLRDNGYLMKQGSSKNMPTQKSMDLGLFEVKERTIDNPDGSVRITKTTKLTGKGQVYFLSKFVD